MAIVAAKNSKKLMWNFCRIQGGIAILHAIPVSVLYPPIPDSEASVMRRMFHFVNVIKFMFGQGYKPIKKG